MLLTFSGALNLDIIVEIESLAPVSAIVGEELVPGREYIISHETLIQLKNLIDTKAKTRYVGGGGSSANTCMVLARLGHETAFIGTCGEDDLGDLVLSSMDGVNLKYVKRDDKTASCIIFLTKNNKDRTILVAPGSQAFIKDEWGDIDFLHLSSLPSKEGLEFHKKIVERLPREAILTIDPGEIYSQMGKDALWPLLTRTNILLLTSREYEMLFGDTSFKEILGILCKARTEAPIKFDRALVIKQGAEGAMCFVDQGEYKMEAEHINNVVDNTGAGDAFNAGFLDTWLKGGGPEECLGYANKLAALSLQDWGRNWLRRLNSDD